MRPRSIAGGGAPEIAPTMRPKALVAIARALTLDQREHRRQRDVARRIEPELAADPGDHSSSGRSVASKVAITAPMMAPRMTSASMPASASARTTPAVRKAAGAAADQHEAEEGTPRLRPSPPRQPWCLGPGMGGLVRRGTPAPSRRGPRT